MAGGKTEQGGFQPVSELLKVSCYSIKKVNLFLYVYRIPMFILLTKINRKSTNLQDKMLNWKIIRKNLNLNK